MKMKRLRPDLSHSGWWFAVPALVLVLSAPRPALAESCGSIAAKKMAGQIWKGFIKKSLGVGPLPVKVAAAKAGVLTWANSQNNSWSKIGPRQLTFARQQGTVVSAGNRTWVTSIPYDLNRADLVFKKMDGEGKVKVTVCKHTQDGRHDRIDSFEVDKGSGNSGDTWSRSLNRLQDAVISVHVDGRHLLKRLQYEVRLRRPNQGKILEPVRNNLGPVKGFADVHAHMMAHIAFGGGWSWGDPGKPLRACDGKSHSKWLGLPLKIEHGGWHKKRTQPGVDWPHYSDPAHCQFHASHLQKAMKGFGGKTGMRLLVMTAVNNEFMCAGMAGQKKPDNRCDDMDSVKLQVRAVRDFEKKHPWFRVALDPWQARKIIHQGKLAVVIAAEISNLMPKSLGEWRDQLDELYDMGVRSFELAHETDSIFSGSAQQKGGMFKVMNYSKRVSTLQPSQFLSLFKNQRNGDCNGDLRKGDCNTVGLNDCGRELVARMVRRSMLIPLDHISRVARGALYREITKKHNYYPLFASHSRFDELIQDEKERDGAQEYMLTREHVNMIKATGGVFGLRTGSNRLGDRKPPRGCKVPNTCHGSSHSIGQMVCEGNNQGVHMALGSDMNGAPIDMTAPRFAGGRQRPDGKPAACPANKKERRGEKPDSSNRLGTEFDTAGLKDIGMEPDLLADLEKLGADTSSLHSSAETFLMMWQRAYQKKRCKLSARQYQDMARGKLAPGRCTEAKPAAEHDGGTGKCPGVASVRKCKRDRECKANQWCYLGVAGIGANICKTKLAEGSLCTKKQVCLSGRCYLGRCKAEVACKKDRDCGSGKYCDKGTVGIGKNQCKSKKSKSSGCTRKAQCKSGRCKWGKCK